MVILLSVIPFLVFLGYGPLEVHLKFHLGSVDCLACSLFKFFYLNLIRPANIYIYYIIVYI